MSCRTPRYAKRSVVIAAVLLLTGVLFGAATATNAFALSPHVRADVDTSSCAACHFSHAATSSRLLRAEDISANVTQSCLACHNGSDGSTSNIASGI